MNFINQLLGNIKKRRVNSSFKHNICSVDLADMQLISKYNKGIRYLLCAIDLFSKYAFVPLSILNNLRRKPNKIWTDQDSES